MRSSKHIYEKSKKVWFNLVANHVIQCKSKNSRMGKGKGMFERRIIRVRKNTIFFEFSGISYYKLRPFIKKINKKLNIKTTLVYKNNNFYKNINPRYNSRFYTRYLLTN